MKYPDFIKTTGRVCPKHRCPTYYDESGKERCGACDLYHANKNYNDSIPTGSKLDDYYREKKEQKGKHRSTLERSTGDVLKKVMRVPYKD
jgi:hypothetical protein